MAHTRSVAKASHVLAETIDRLPPEAQHKARSRTSTVVNDVHDICKFLLAATDNRSAQYLALLAKADYRTKVNAIEMDTKVKNYLNNVITGIFRLTLNELQSRTGCRPSGSR